MKKQISLLIIIITSFSIVRAQPKTFKLADTIIVLLPKAVNVQEFDKKFHGADFYYQGDTLYRLRKKQQLTNATQEPSQYTGKYFVFITDRGQRLFESRWDFEALRGPFKRYHKNGKIAEEGTYSPYSAWSKIGTWKYYNSKGMLIKEEQYNDKGILQDSKKY